MEETKKRGKGRPPKWTNREIPSFYKEKENERV